MTLENVTYALLAQRLAELLRKNAKIENWLGGRDSNPDTVVQSHVSYRWTTSHQPRRQGTRNLKYSDQPGGDAISCVAAVSLAHVRSHPINASTSNRPGLADRPVAATRTA